MREETKRRLAKVPNLLSFARFGLVPFIYYAAYVEDRALFALLVLVTVLTDILDGPIARVSGVASRFGSNLDSAADLVFYLSLPAWAYMFDPSLVQDHWVLITLMATLYVVANVLSHRMFGAMGVHNRLSRASGTAGVAFTFYSILYGIEPILYVALVAVLSMDLAQRYGAIVRARWRGEALNGGSGPRAR